MAEKDEIHDQFEKLMREEVEKRVNSELKNLDSGNIQVRISNRNQMRLLLYGVYYVVFCAGLFMLWRFVGILLEGCSGIYIPPAYVEFTFLMMIIWIVCSAIMLFKTISIKVRKSNN